MSQQLNESPFPDPKDGETVDDYLARVRSAPSDPVDDEAIDHLHTVSMGEFIKESREAGLTGYPTNIVSKIAEEIQKRRRRVADLMDQSASFDLLRASLPLIQDDVAVISRLITYLENDNGL